MCDLKACPFCGGEAERVTLKDEENFNGDVIVCQSCNSCSAVMFGEKEGLVDIWNSRVEDFKKLKLLIEINQYLDYHKENAIHSGSKLHMKIKEVLK